MLNNIVFELTTNPKYIYQYLQIRHNVYVNEKKYLLSCNSMNIEYDCFDFYAKYFLILTNKIVIGGVRFIELQDYKIGLPVISSISIDEFLTKLEQRTEHSLSNKKIAEISRLIVTKPFRNKGFVNGLFREIYIYCKKLNISVLLCTANNKTIDIYKKIGFKYINVDKKSQQDYKLSGDWWALYLDLDDMEMIRKLDKRFFIN